MPQVLWPSLSSGSNWRGGERRQPVPVFYKKRIVVLQYPQYNERNDGVLVEGNYRSRVVLY